MGGTACWKWDDEPKLNKKWCFEQPHHTHLSTPTLLVTSHTAVYNDHCAILGTLHES